MAVYQALAFNWSVGPVHSRPPAFFFKAQQTSSLQEKTNVLRKSLENVCWPPELFLSSTLWTLGPHCLTEMDISVRFLYFSTVCGLFLGLIF